MCENGRVLHHLLHSIEDRDNLILFVSYQGQNTLGSRILGRAPFVRILGQDRKVRAEVRRIEAFSGHADHDDLVNWVAPQAHRLKGVFLVHGEVDRMQMLADGLRDIGVRAVHMPARGESFAL
jgi:metallo-beta-lactamase family protein